MPEAQTETQPTSNASTTPPLTQEERDRASAEKYRSQLDGQVETVNEEGVAPPANEAAKPQRPENVPEKFWDAEKGEVRMDAMLKSISELERKLSQPKPAAKPGAAASETENGENAGGEQPNGDESNPDPVAEAVKGFQSLRESVSTKLIAGQEITDEDYQAFEKHGFSRDEVDAHIAGQIALGQLAKMEVHQAVGGEEKYAAMIEWARSNFDAKEVEVYDRDIHSGDSAVRLTAARGLAARYQMAMGTDGTSVTDGKNTSRNNDGYSSGSEMRDDMRDPRYKTSEHFRNEVARKAAAARRAGIDLQA